MSLHRWSFSKAFSGQNHSLFKGYYLPISKDSSSLYEALVPYWFCSNTLHLNSVYLTQVCFFEAPCYYSIWDIIFLSYSPFVHISRLISFTIQFFLLFAFSFLFWTLLSYLLSTCIKPSQCSAHWALSDVTGCSSSYLLIFYVSLPAAGYTTFKYYFIFLKCIFFLFWFGFH